ncbi:MAG: arsenate reductase/protein-tyrosine-phosphatase family protein, partial [Frankiaceae bacterium]
RSYDPKADDGDLDVPDPYYGGHDGFERVLTLIEAAAAGVIAHVAEELAG